MAVIRDLRDFLGEARRRERVHEFTEPINKESELMPLYRVQTRGLPEEWRNEFPEVCESSPALKEQTLSKWRKSLEHDRYR